MEMRGILLSKFVVLSVDLLIVSVIAFLLIYIIPGDIAAEIAGPTATEQQVQSIRAHYGLDRPFPERVIAWYGNALQGDLGRSFLFDRPVAGLIAERLPLTLSLTLAATLLAATFGIALGTLAALRRGTFTDLSVSAVAVLGLSIPEFWLGITAIYLIAVEFSLLPTGGYAPLSRGIGEWARHLALPVAVLALTNTGYIARITRTAVLEVISMDFIRTAEAKGLSYTRIVAVHVMRNSFKQIVTAIGVTLGVLFGGAFVVEVVFSLPGLGRLIIDAIQRRDIPTIQGGLLIAGAAFAIVNAALETIYLVIDPRLRK
jgi:peptide/nickel transport system permease protein